MPPHRVPLAATLVVACLLVPAAAADACAGAKRPVGANVARAARATRCLVDAARARAGLSRLRDAGALDRAAAAHARDMVRRGFFDHVSPGGSTTARARAARGSRARRSARPSRGRPARRRPRRSCACGCTRRPTARCCSPAGSTPWASASLTGPRATAAPARPSPPTWAGSGGRARASAGESRRRWPRAPVAPSTTSRSPSTASAPASP